MDGPIPASTTRVSERRRAYRALVVEDDPPTLRLVRKVLEREGFFVEGVRDGQAAINLLETVAYDLLIIDLMLPLINGDQVVSFLEQHQPESIRRVIITTASPRLIRCEVLQQICRVLEKPFDIDRLVLYARECMDDAA